MFDDILEKAMLRRVLESDHLLFTRYFFQKRLGVKFIVSPHHRVISKALNDVFTGKIKRLIINIPPRYAKTEMAVISFISMGFAINPMSKFIHVSSSKELSLENSMFIKDLTTCDSYQELWPIDLKSDSKSKGRWSNEMGGGLLATSSGGQITGFGAGMISGEFSGAFVIDDPIKPDDAYSETIRNRINNRFTNTFKSRLANEDVPIIIIMQRIHENDPTGFLLRGGTGDKWHHLVLPANIGTIKKKYPEEYTHGIEIDTELSPGALWPLKHTDDQLKVMESADPYTFSSQYQQSPTIMGGAIFRDEWWRYYTVEPYFEYKFITADTAQKTGEHNDYSVFQCWGVFENKIYLIDQLRDKLEANDLKIRFISFWEKHNRGGNQPTGKLRNAYIEDKSSGTGLIQDIMKFEKIPVVAVQRNRDKYSRAMDMVPYIASGKVYLPERAPWLNDYILEFSKFTATNSHNHDDQIDPTLDAIDITFRPKEKSVGAW